MKRVRGREVLVPGLTLLALTLIGLVALLEKGPLEVVTAPGAYPGNSGPLGTSILYQKLKENYTVIPVTNWGYARNLLGSCNVSVVVIIVSPELPYTQEDLDSIGYLRSSCRKFSLLVADEGGLSNAVLSSLGSSVRIEGLILQPHHITMYVETPWGWRGWLLLDKASRVTSLTLANAKPIGFAELPLSVPVAYYESVNGLELVAVGDGSILLNQVLQSSSSIAGYYLDFLRSTVAHLCGYTGNCVILLEASKYKGLDPVEVLRSGDRRLLGLINMIDLVVALLARILHPSTWLPPLLSMVDYGIKSLMESSPYIKGFIAVVLAILLALIAPREGRVRDSRLEDVVEVEWYGFGEFRRRLLARGAGLTREDFITLYNLVDTTLKTVVGVSLEDPQLPTVLQSIGLDRDAVEKYRNYMVKYYRRATGRSIWPPIVLWGRVTRKAIVMSESILSPLGASLMTLSRLERIEERGLRGNVGS